MLNRYAYVLNNPYKYTDPTGNCPICFYVLYAAGTFVIADVITPAITVGLPATVALTSENVGEYGVVKGIGVTAGQLVVGSVIGKAIGAGIGYAGGKVITSLGSKSIQSSNPWGRHGSPAHQLAVAKEAASLSKNGWVIKAGGGGREVRVKIPGSNNYRYPDIIAAKNGQDLYVNIGRVNANGQPVSREVSASNDLAKTGKQTKFVSYSSCQATGNAACH